MKGYTHLSKPERAIVLKVWRQSFLYPLPKAVVKEWIEEELEKFQLIR